MRFRAGSLFSGIAGLDLAVEWAGHEVAWFCENDPNPRKVLARHYPGVPIYGDVTTLDFSKVEPIDLLIGGGFPCPPFSDAGKRLGDDDPRYLWPPVARAVRALRPRVVVLEQVSAFLRFPQEFGRTIGDLAEAGYRVRWAGLRASDVGAPHRRERWFAVAHASQGTDDGQWPRAQSRQGGATAHDPAGESGNFLDGERLRAVAHARSNGAQQEQSEDGRVAVLEPPRSDRATVTDADQSRLQGWSGDNLASREGKAAPFDWGAYEPAIRRWERILGRLAPNPLIDGKLSHHFVEWMMGLPEGWTEPLSRTAALRALGNAVVPQQAYAALTALGLPVGIREGATA